MLGGRLILNKMKMYENINIAFEKYTTSWCSINKIEVEKAFGKDVLELVERIYAYVSEYQVNWKIDTMETALEKLENDIKINYSFLSDKTIKKLKSYFSYNWK